MLRMTISPTCCVSLVALLLLVLVQPEADAHSVHRHTGAEADSTTGAATPRDLLQRYSVSGDDHLLAVARQALADSTGASAAEKLLYLAWLAQAEHDFKQASVLLGRLLAEQPGNGQAWLLEAAVAQVVGDIDRYRRACSRVALSISPMASVTCFARQAVSLEERRRAYERLQDLTANTDDVNLMAWHFSVRAELAWSLGEMAAAERDLRYAIAAVPSVQRRAALMDLLLQQQRYTDALAVDPAAHAVPAIAVRQVLAKRGLGFPVDLTVRTMDLRFKEWLDAGDYRHAREIAMFYLDVLPDPELAYDVARRNARLQREAEDMALLARAEGMQ